MGGDQRPCTTYTLPVLPKNVRGVLRFWQSLNGQSVGLSFDFGSDLVCFSLKGLGSKNCSACRFSQKIWFEKLSYGQK